MAPSRPPLLLAWRSKSRAAAARAVAAATATLLVLLLLLKTSEDASAAISSSSPSKTSSAAASVSLHAKWEAAPLVLEAVEAGTAEGTKVSIGNPTGKDWSVDYELRDLRSFFRETKVMIGLETTWDNVRSTTADVLQLSTEFLGQSRTHPLGELVLSNGLTVEGAVRVRFDKLSEMTGIPVVVLSNLRGQGEGLNTLHAALLRLNGTSDVFLNAWFADRRAAKFFSEYFYTHLANGLAPGDAYRQALLSLIRSREVSHQRAWGQFFHYGIG